MNKLTESQVDELLMLYDDLYRMTSTPLWHEQRRRPESNNFKIHEECYDKFKNERALANAESGFKHYKALIEKLKN